MPIPPPPAPANAVTRTGLELVQSALRLLGVIAPGEAMAASEANDALDAFNEMLDGWNADGQKIYTTSIRDFPFVNGKQSYTVGSGGDFDMTRPAAITGMSSIIQSAGVPVEFPIGLFNEDRWRTELPVKQVYGSFPQIYYDDGSFPLRTLYFWPIPQGADNSVRIYSWLPLILAQSLADTVVMPPGYMEAFRYNLAIRLAPEYQVTASAEIVQTAKNSLARLATMNAVDVGMRSDLLAAAGSYDNRAELFGNPWA